MREETPIYSQLAAEMTCAPLCQVCGKPDLQRIEQEHWLLCWDCHLRGFGYAEERKHATCSACGKFPLAWDDHMVRLRIETSTDGRSVDSFCREHFQAAEAMRHA